MRDAVSASMTSSEAVKLVTSEPEMCFHRSPAGHVWETVDLCWKVELFNNSGISKKKNKEGKKKER